MFVLIFKRYQNPVLCCTHALSSTKCLQHKFTACLQRRNIYIIVWHDWPLGAVPWLKRLVAGLSPWRPGLVPRTVHVRSVEGRVALGHVSLPALGYRQSVLFHHHFILIYWSQRLYKYSSWQHRSVAHPHTHPLLITTSHLHTNNRPLLITTSHLHTNNHPLLITTSHLHTNNHPLLITSIHLHTNTLLLHNCQKYTNARRRPLKRAAWEGIVNC